MDDPDLDHKLRQVLVDGFEPILAKFRTTATQDIYAKMKDIWVNKYKRPCEWSKAKDYHVTVLYVGKDEEVAEES